MLTNPISAAQYYLQVTEAEERILKILNECSSLTASEIAAKANLKSATNLSKSLQEMRRAGYITRDFNDKYAKWSLNPDHYAAILTGPPTANYHPAYK